MIGREMEVVCEDIAGVATHITIDADYGHLTAIYSEKTAKFGITYVNVKPEFRGEGLSKELLSRSVEVAQNLGASIMHATIISRESLESFRSVFGENSILVEHEGTFKGDANSGARDTVANLWHEMVEVPAAT